MFPTVRDLRWRLIELDPQPGQPKTAEHGEPEADSAAPNASWSLAFGSITAFEARRARALNSSCMVPDMGNARFCYAC
jgi:hypothetical protein